MKRHLVFIHQNYPAQFGPILPFLQKNYEIEISFLSQYTAKPVMSGIRHFFYQPAKTGYEEKPYFFSRYFDQEVAAMHGIYATLEQNRIQADCFIGHTGFGAFGLLHSAYPEIPKIGFFELFYQFAKNARDTRPEYPTPKPNYLRIPLRNATQLIELEYCTKGYSPTPYQKSTYPTAYQQKLSVLFDGIDTQRYQPGPVSSDSALQRTWPKDAKIVTYVSRGLEAMRGFDIFMKVAHRICQTRSDVHFVIAGNPKTHYGSEMINLQEATFKDFVLKQEPYDLNRFHFLEWIPEEALVDLFRLSDCHFYWTTPFTLSWSLLQAMATGCLIVGSKTAPIQDAIQDRQNGFLIDPYEIEALTEKILEVLASPTQCQTLRDAARDTALQRYSFEVCLPKLAEFYLST